MASTAFNSLPHRNVWSLAWPMILSNLTVPLLSLVDTAILGHLDSAIHLGAVALGASVITIVFWSMGFLRMGTTSLVAQAVGEQDDGTQQRLLLQSAILGFCLGLLLIALQQPLLGAAFWWLDVDATLEPLAREYSAIRLLGAPAVLINLTLIGWLLGQQNARIPLVLMVSTNIINLLLDLLFILGFGWESRGAALATVCADYSGMLLGIYMVLRLKPELRHFQQWSRLTNPNDYRQLISINRDLFFRTLILLFTFLYFNAQGAKLGTDVLAANSIMFQLLLLASYGLDGLAHASEALVGKAVGANEFAQFKRITLTTGIWSGVIAVLMSLMFITLQSWLPVIFTNIDSIEAQLSRYLPWVFALPLVSVMAFWLDGVYIGAGAVRVMLIGMLISSCLVFFPLLYVFQNWGNHGLWLAFCGFNLCRGLSLLIYLPRLTRRIQSSTNRHIPSTGF